MKVRVKVRPPRFVVLLLMGLLAFGSLWMLRDPAVYVLGVEANATVLDVQPGAFCPGDNRWRECYDVSLLFTPPGGVSVKTTAGFVTYSSAAASGVARGKVLPVRYLSFMPGVVALRDNALDPVKLLGGLVLGWIAFMPLVRLALRGPSRTKAREEQISSYASGDFDR